jgi:acylphosphatase
VDGEQRLTASVCGLVQGVGFRAFVRREARRLGLTGCTWNAPDGSVEVVAEGPVEDLEMLRRALRTGPMGSRVTGVKDRLEPATGDYDGFDIAL